MTYASLELFPACHIESDMHIPHHNIPCSAKILPRRAFKRQTVAQASSATSPVLDVDSAVTMYAFDTPRSRLNCCQLFQKCCLLLNCSAFLCTTMDVALTQTAV